MKRTERGFAIYSEFKDAYGQDVRIQESSWAEKGAVWIFCHKNGEDCLLHLGKWQAYSPHLTKAMARQVIKALQTFVDR